MSPENGLPGMVGSASPETSLRAWLRRAETELEELGPEEARAHAERLCEAVLGLTRTQLYLHLEQKLSPPQEDRLRRLVEARKQDKPLAYLVGTAHFWEETVEVGPGCLIPRPETETLIEKFVEKSGYDRDRCFSLLDLGCGSGIIGIALLRRYRNARVSFSDVSEPALAWTRRNVARYGLGSRAEIIQSDLFSAWESTRKQWDVILSNPPYLSERDWKQIDPQLFSEPRIALDGGADGLDFYRCILKNASKYLVAGGWLGLEVGLGQAARVAKGLSETEGFGPVSVFADHSGIERVVLAQRKF